MVVFASAAPTSLRARARPVIFERYKRYKDRRNTAVHADTHVAFAGACSTE